MNIAIPFNKATILDHELEYIEASVRSGIISGEGTYTQRCEEFIESLMGETAGVLLTPSCTSALEMCSLLLDVGEGDEVIMPSFTFVSTATAFARRGVFVRFADVDPITLNVSPAEIRRCLTEKTKAIVVVHYAGYACEMDEILAIAQEAGIPVIEDAAHALGATYKNRALGSLGALSTFSFHETKNVTCGEGGALVVNDEKFLDRSHIIRDKGTNRKAFQRGSVEFYTWVDIGSSYVMSDVLAAFLYAQLEQLPRINGHRREIHQRYQQRLEPLKQRGCLEYPSYLSFDESSAHLFFVLLEDKQERIALQEFLLNKGICAVFHYQPLHRSPYAVRTWGEPENLPVTERAGDTLLRLPMYNTLSLEEVDSVCDGVEAFFAQTS